MLLILKKLFSTWLFHDIFRYDSPKKCPTILYADNLWLKPVSATGASMSPAHSKLDRMTKFNLMLYRRLRRRSNIYLTLFVCCKSTNLFSPLSNHRPYACFSMLAHCPQRCPVYWVSLHDSTIIHTMIRVCLSYAVYWEELLLHIIYTKVGMFLLKIKTGEKKAR